jgi:hypothetical protein
VSIEFSLCFPGDSRTFAEDRQCMDTPDFRISSIELSPHSETEHEHFDIFQIGSYNHCRKEAEAISNLINLIIPPRQVLMLLLIFHQE